MKKRVINQLVAVVLSGAMVLGQSGMALAAEDASSLASSAEEEIPEATSEGSSTESGDESAESSDGSSDDEIAENTTENTPEKADGSSEDDTSEENGDASDENPSEDEAAESSTEAGEEASLESSEADEEAPVEDELPKGLVGMPEGYKLSSDERKIKEDLIAHDVLDAFDELVEGADYVPGEVICFAENEEHAQMIATAYSADLKEYSYGVAVLDLSDSPLDVADAFEYGLTPEFELPAVEPNYTRDLIEPGYIESDTDSKLFGASSETSAGIQTWEMLYDSLGADADPFLNPANTVEPAYYQWHLQYINAYAAWSVTKGSTDVTVAVIDTGCENHEDIPSDRMVRPDGLVTYDIKDGQEVIYGSHGTHVTGIIGAQLGNGKGGSGVAPGVKVMPINAYTQMIDHGEPVVDGNGNPVCTFEDDNLIRSIMYVAGFDKADDIYNDVSTRRADIINLSLGGTAYSGAIDDAIQRAHDKGVTVVAAMGNESGTVKSYPAGYDNVISVAATSFDGRPTEFSNLGSWADVAAPGDTIYSTSTGGKYEEMSGTSQATPVISGACALYKSIYPEATPDQIESAIKNAVTPVSYGGIGTGIIDLAKLFGGDTLAPRIRIMDSMRTIVAGADVAYGESLTLPIRITDDHYLYFIPTAFNSDEEANTSTRIIYTTDGSVPGYKAGEITNGKLYDNNSVDIGGLFSCADEDGYVTIKAISVTGIGVASGYTTLRFPVGETKETVELPATVTILNKDMLQGIIAGKSITLSAVVEDNTGKVTGEKVTWAISSYYDGDLSGASIGAGTGKLTTKAGQSGVLVITCTTVDTKVSDSVAIWVSGDINPVKTLGLSQKSVALSYSHNGTGESKDVSISTLIDTKNINLLEGGWEYISFVWTSSNEEVARIVRQTDVPTTGPDYVSIIATGAGKATITCAAMDGSGKKATVAVTVTGDSKVTGVSLRNGSDPVTAATVYVGENFDLTADQTASSGGAAAAPVWTTSNPKVARIQYSYDDRSKIIVIPAGKGTATVTATARDGSGKKATVKFTVLQQVEEISIIGQSYITPGTSATYKAQALPANANNKNVEWALVYKEGTEYYVVPDDDPVSIDKKTGKVSASADAVPGSVYYLWAGALDKKETGDNAFCEKEITIKEKVSSIGIYAGPECSEEQAIREVTLACNSDTGLTQSMMIYAKADNGTALSFASSNPKVVYLDSYHAGNNGVNTAAIEGLKKGTATITVASLDGSKVKATLKVKVVEPVTEISLTGQRYIVKCGNATYKVSAVLPKGASNKNVEWAVGKIKDIEGETVFEPLTADSGVTIVKGKVTVSASPSVDSFFVRALAADGSGTAGYMPVDIITSKITGITVKSMDDKDTVSSAKLFTVNVNKDDTDESRLEVKAVLTGCEAGSPDTVDWKSSNEKVAKAVALETQNCAVIEAVAPGSATVTCLAQDGSGKKATIKVTVITPVSDLQIRIAGNNSDVVAYGKSAKLIVTAGDAYGKPTNTKVTWDYEIMKTDNVITFDGGNGAVPISSSGLAEKVKKEKKLFTFSNGKVTVNSNYYKNREKYDAEYYYDGNAKMDRLAAFVIKATATAQDGSGATASKYLYPVKPAPKFNFYLYTRSGLKKLNGGVRFALSDFFPQNTENDAAQYGEIYVTYPYYNAENDYYGWGYPGQTDEFSDNMYAEYFVTSSNDKVATVNLSTQMIGLDTVSALEIYPHAVGTTKITLKAKDGSGLTKTLPIKVVEKY